MEKKQASKRFKGVVKSKKQRKAVLKGVDQIGKKAYLRAGLDKNGNIK